MSGLEPWGIRVPASLALAWLVGCGRTEVSHAPAAALASALAPAPALAAPPASTPALALALASASWPALVRGEQWDAAWTELQALPDSDKARPEIRYVRARVALSRADAATALPLLDGLEAVLPLLADDVMRRRAEAKLVVGPFAEAGEWFALRAAPGPQLEAARAFEKARDLRRARAAADRVIGGEHRSRDEEAEARALRVRVAEAAGDAERADARWLAIEGADLSAATDAVALVGRLDPKRPLTAEEMLARAKVLSDAGRVDDALRAIDLAAGAPGADKLTNLARERARGAALYRAHGRSSEAAKVLAECAGAGGPNAAEDAFHAARALSRADRDEEAVRGYRDRRGEQRFREVRLGQIETRFSSRIWRMLHGEWKDCARGFDAYLHGRGAGDDVRDARRDGALCKLLDGETKTSRAAFEQLVEDEPDPIVSSRMADMAALAALRDGDRTHAVARWTDVARSRPLSWPALVARARLLQVAAPVPPAIDPAEVQPGSDPPAVAVVVPPPAELLHQLGLELDAEAALRDRETAVTIGAGGRAPEALCKAYGEIGRARRRYQIAQSLPSALFAAAPGTRTRWAWECAFPSPYAEQVRAARSAN